MNLVSTITKQCIYFSLVDSLYAAEYEKTIIMLDRVNDKYLSLIDQAVLCLKIILNNSFKRDEFGNYHMQSGDNDSEELNYWIAYFQENQFITVSTAPNKNHIAASPLQKGGLCNYQWDLKSSWNPFAVASAVQIFWALQTLIKVHWVIKRSGINGLFDVINKNSPPHTTLIFPEVDALAQLAATVDAATLLYPKKTFCLAWSATLVLLALKKRWDVSLVIGVQANPFYAHAWAQTSDGTVIHDDAQVAQVLSKIVTTPFLRE